MISDLKMEGRSRSFPGSNLSATSTASRVPELVPAIRVVSPYGAMPQMQEKVRFRPQRSSAPQSTLVLLRSPTSASCHRNPPAYRRSRDDRQR